MGAHRTLDRGLCCRGLRAAFWNPVAGFYHMYQETLCLKVSVCVGSQGRGQEGAHGDRTEEAVKLERGLPAVRRGSPNPD